ncbi:hypothetical protein D3C76_1104820 [compost metagenome]
MRGLPTGTVTVKVKTARLVSQQMKQGAGKGRANHKCQAMIADAESADLAPPLLYGARLVDWWELGSSVIEMQVLAVLTDLTIRQQECIVVPAQTGNQSCPLRAIKTLQIALQVVARMPA